MRRRSLAGHLGLGRLISFYDQNHISIEGDTKLAFTEDVGKRYEAYGWHVQDLEEDVGLDNLQQALETAIGVEDKPSLIIVRTHIAQGSPNKHDTAGAHGSPLGEEEVKLTKEHMGWPSLEPFFVPEEALKHFRRCIERGEELETEWRERFDAYREAHPELAPELERMIAGKLPEGWDREVPKFHASGSMTATRKSSETVIQWAAANVPELVGGSADLAPSTLTLIADGGSVEPGSYDGRNLHFGIREHAMGAIVNGMNLHYLRAFGATFFTFSDYMRGSIRLAALMHLRSIFVFTHDSIGLGEDGPTHQPIEQLAGLRAMPVLRVVRPAGANETALAWHYAIKSTDHPTALVLSRQGIPTWNPSAIPADAIDRGAYVLRYSFNEPDPPDLILIATGTELHICARAADTLEAEGIATRLVSMPCMENFAAQDAEYRDQGAPAAGSGTRLARSGGHVRLASVGRRARRGDRDARVRRVRSGRRSVQALWFHPRTRRRRREGGRQARALERSRLERRDQREHHHRAQSPVVSDNRGGRQRVARPDSPFDGGRGRAGADGRGGVAARRHLESLDLREGDPRVDRLRRGPQDARAREPRFGGDLRAHRDPRRAVGGRRARRRAPGSARTRRVRVARGRAGARAQHRGHARAGPLVLAARRSSERDDQDPGDAGGRARDRAGPVRGHQRQCHVAVRGRCVREGG